MTGIVILSVVAALCAAVAAAFAGYSKGAAKYRNDASLAQKRANEAESKLTAYQEIAAKSQEESERRMKEMKADFQQRLNSLKQDFEESKKEIRQNYEKSIAEIRKNSEESLNIQAKTLRAEMSNQTETLLKQREEELSKSAAKTFANISDTLGKELKDMKTAFEENKTANSQTSAAMKENLENAVKMMAQQTRDIGAKADNLAEAMRGQKKLQGCWGETILLNILQGEGFVEGRDFDKEETLRNEEGFVILNEESDKKMRPDYILHFVDNQDVIVDSKVSLAAYMDYVDATDDAARQEAASHNLANIKEQIKKLSAKNYSDYLLPEHKMVDYVIMFVPIYSALQLAYQYDENLWKNAFAQKVLITTPETIMPYLRMINLAWRNVEQVKNQQRIITAAENMIARVADFSKDMATVGQKLADAQKAYDSAEKKLKNAGQGILVSAHQVVSLGVKAKKQLPPVEE